MSTIYILQKDLPKNKSGTEFILADYKDKDGSMFYIPTDKPAWGVDKDESYLKTTVENNPEWFKKKEERIVINYLSQQKISPECGIWYQFLSSKPLEEKSISAIIKAIEFIVNNEINEYQRPLDKTKIRTGSGDKIYYTKEDMILCFNAAKETVLETDIQDSSSKLKNSYNTFEDYINSLK